MHNMTDEEKTDIVKQIVELLEMAHKIEMFRQIRSRYASTEQWAEEEKRIRGLPEQHWFAAKRMICDNIELARNAAKDIEIIDMALKVIDKETDEELENTFTTKF